MAGFMDFLTGDVRSSFPPEPASETPPPAPPAPEPPPSARFDALFDQASKETGIPAAILKAQAMQESTFDPNVISTTGGIGLLQIQPSTAKDPGFGLKPIDPAKLTDPAENVRFGARYLAARAKAEGVQNWNDPQQVAKALAAYNGGGDPNYAQNVFRYLKPPNSAQPQPAANGPFDMNGNPLPPRYGPRAQTPQDAPDAQPVGQPAAQPVAPRPFFRPAPGIPVRPGVDMDNIGEGARGVFGALAKLNIPDLEVVSGYRDPARNARVGGAKGSQHIHGNAIDINIEKLSDEDRARVIETAYKAGARGIGIYPGGRSLHFDVREAPAAWGANPAAPYSGVSDPNAFPAWARPTLAQLLKGQNLPPQATAYAAASPGASAAPRTGVRNPTVQAAAERGRGSLADRFAMGGNVAEGPSAMPFQPMPDLSNSPDGGARDFMLREAGGAPASQDGGGLAGIFGMLTGNRQAGPASVPAGMVIPGGERSAPSPAATVESLMPFNRPRLLGLFGAGARENEEAAREHQGKVFAAKQLVAQGMSPQDAVAAINSPGIGQQLALGTIAQRRAAQEQAALRARLDSGQGGVASPTPVEAGGAPAPAQAQPTQIAASTEPTSAARISTGNKTVDTLFAQRSAKVAELAKTLKEPTTANTESIIKSRAEALKAEIGNIDKRMEQYAPTSTIKEYTFAMAQRQEQGKPIISLEAFDAEQRKAGATNVNVGGGSDAQIFKTVEDSYKLAKSAASGLKGLQEARKAVEGGIVSGAGAELQLQLRKIASSAFGVEDEKITNTETFLSAIAPQIGAIIQANFGGAQISDGDRKFAQDAAAGRISLDGSSIKRILGIMEKANRAILEDHNRKVDAVYEDAPDGKFKRERALFSVPMPKEEQAASPAPVPAAPPMPPQPSNIRPDGSSPPTPRDEWLPFEGGRIRRIQ